MTPEQYTTTLPLVLTATLPYGALFWAENRLYQVVQVDRSGYNRAREWGKTEKTDVALIPNSTLAQRLRVVDKGRLLPVIKSRGELLQNGRAVHYVFPMQQTAQDAGSLDETLCGRNSGLYLRRHQQHSAYELTNGSQVFRYYYFYRLNEGLETNLHTLKDRLDSPLISHKEGPAYWRLLSSWDESPYYDLNQTMAFRPVDLLERLQDTAPNTSTADNDEDTLLNIPTTWE